MPRRSGMRNRSQESSSAGHPVRLGRMAPGIHESANKRSPAGARHGNK